MNRAGGPLDLSTYPLITKRDVSLPRLQEDYSFPVSSNCENSGKEIRGQERYHLPIQLRATYANRVPEPLQLVNVPYFL